jgi:Leucine-rich repeat (LRR) protein
MDSFDLTDFVNLKKLDCSDNKLTSINLSSCEKLAYLDCSDNQLTALHLPKQGKELIEVKI